MQRAAFRCGPQHARQSIDAARRECETLRRGRKAGRVGDRGHFDGRLGPVEEGVEHLGVEIALRDLFGRKAVVAPDSFRSRVVIDREILGAFACGDHLESGRAGPIDQLADERGLIAVGERVDNAGLSRAARKQRACEGIGLDVYHHDMPAMLAAGQHVANAGRRISRRLHDDFDLPRCDDCE